MSFTGIEQFVWYYGLLCTIVGETIYRKLCVVTVILYAVVLRESSLMREGKVRGRGIGEGGERKRERSREEVKDEKVGRYRSE